MEAAHTKRSQGFNEAGARTPRMPPFCGGSCHVMLRRFNEAGARTPRMQRKISRGLYVSRGFNEAGARTPRMLRVSRSQHATSVALQ